MIAGKMHTAILFILYIHHNNRVTNEAMLVLLHSAHLIGLIFGRTVVMDYTYATVQLNSTPIK